MVLRDIRGYEFRISRKMLGCIVIEYGKKGLILMEYFRNTSSQAGPKTSDYFRTLGANRSVFSRILTGPNFWLLAQ